MTDSVRERVCDPVRVPATLAADVTGAMLSASPAGWSIGSMAGLTLLTCFLNTAMVPLQMT